MSAPTSADIRRRRARNRELAVPRRTAVLMRLPLGLISVLEEELQRRVAQGEPIPDFGVTAVWGYGARGSRPDVWTRHDLILALLAERIEDLGYPSPAGGRGWRIK